MVQQQTGRQLQSHSSVRREVMSPVETVKSLTNINIIARAIRHYAWVEDSSIPRDKKPLPFKEMFPQLDPELRLIAEFFISSLLASSEDLGLNYELIGSAVRELIRPNPRIVATNKRLHSYYLGAPIELQEFKQGVDVDAIVDIHKPDEITARDRIMGGASDFVNYCNEFLAVAKKPALINQILQQGSSRTMECKLDDNLTLRVHDTAVKTNTRIRYIYVQFVRPIQTKSEKQTEVVEEEVFAFHLAFNQPGSTNAYIEKRKGARVDNVQMITLPIHLHDGSRAVIDQLDITKAIEALNRPAFFNVRDIAEFGDPEITKRTERVRILTPPIKLDGDGIKNIPLTRSVAGMMMTDNALSHIRAVYLDLFTKVAKGDFNQTDMQNFLADIQRFSRKEDTVVIDVNPYFWWWLAEMTKGFYALPAFKDWPPYTPRIMFTLRDAFNHYYDFNPLIPEGKKTITAVYQRNEHNTRRQATQWNSGQIKSGLPVFRAGLKKVLLTGTNDLKLPEFVELYQLLFFTESEFVDEPYELFGQPLGHNGNWLKDYLYVFDNVTRKILARRKRIAETTNYLSRDSDPLEAAILLMRSKLGDEKTEAWRREGIFNLLALRLNPLDRALIHNSGLLNAIGDGRSALVPPQAVAEINAVDGIAMKNAAKIKVRKQIFNLASRLFDLSEEFRVMLSVRFQNRVGMNDRNDLLNRFLNFHITRLIEEGVLTEWYPSYKAIFFTPPTQNLLMKVMNLERHSQALKEERETR